jgi:hypothetical protein
MMAPLLLVILLQHHLTLSVRGFCRPTQSSHKPQSHALALSATDTIDADVYGPLRLSSTFNDLSNYMGGSGRAAVIWDCFRAGVDPNLYYRNEDGIDSSDKVIIESWLAATSTEIDANSIHQHRIDDFLGKRKEQVLGASAFIGKEWAESLMLLIILLDEAARCEGSCCCRQRRCRSISGDGKCNTVLHLDGVSVINRKRSMRKQVDGGGRGKVVRRWRWYQFLRCLSSGAKKEQLDYVGSAINEH